MTNLEKRLVSLSNFGICIYHADGHRWIEFCDDFNESFNFEEQLKEYGVALNNKIYGTLSDALDIIDRCLCIMGKGTLLDNFWMDEEDIVGSFGFDDSRIDRVEKNKGGLY